MYRLHFCHSPDYEGLVMDIPEARTELRERFLDLDPEQFETFSKILTQEVEGPAYIQLTPFKGDRGLDLRGEIGHEFVDVRFGSQVKQYSKEIGGPSIRTFVGSLNTNDCHVGCYITSSSYIDSAYEEATASDTPLTLIDRDDILDIMLEYELGVTPLAAESEEYELDGDFWEIFDETSGDELIPSGAIPQANKIPILNVVLEGLDQGYRYKPEIRDYMEAHTGEDWRLRQADYYAMAGWALDYVHKDTVGSYRGKKMRRWGLTRHGQEYVKLRREDRDEQAEAHLEDHIRGMAIVERLMPELQDRKRTTYDELKDVFFDEVALNRTTSDRRLSTVGQWLTMLPEITKTYDGQMLVFVYRSEDERLG